MFEDIYSKKPKWPLQYENPENIKKKQEKKLKNIIKTCYSNHPFYCKLFKENSIDPSLIRSHEDLQKIPVTTKKELIKSSPQDFVLQKRNQRKKLVFFLMTSGTTGNPIIIHITPADLDFILDTSIRECLTLNETSKDVNLITFPPVPHLAYWKGLFHSLAVGSSPLLLGGLGTEKMVRIAQRFNPTNLWIIPSFFPKFINTVKENDINLSSIQKVTLATEKIDEYGYDVIKSQLSEVGADPIVRDCYGATEIRCAYNECSPFSGYHTYPELQLVEIIDPETGEQVGEGESGAIAVTDLVPRGNTLLRYLIGDETKEGLRFEECPECGRTVPRIMRPIKRLEREDEKVNFMKIKGTLVNLKSFDDVISEIISEQFIIEILRTSDKFPADKVRIYIPREVGDKASEEIERRIKNETEITPEIVFENAEKISDMRRQYNSSVCLPPL